MTQQPKMYLKWLKLIIVATSTSQDNEIHSVNDIGNYIGTTLNKITDQERYNILCHPWVPPANFNFPLIAQANKNRSFKLRWITDIYNN
ncbi:52 kDa repressor of the inhibitor of the protein kinase-like [Aphis craccivora]|uniref:52 kDa repressor of the inhibitor of the protein kinase-like n=1 Tax=Aphis craccivora TaxID=307492 RepID=A0A6G0VQ52_APHCR|nr:52 kDa repressor of the inhibitor of the protein kinase-like [Aphis craccivora]